jgi:putative endonuclease
MYFVYILANPHPTSRVLYVGVTADLDGRIATHRARRFGFTARYNVTSLVHVETFHEAIEAIEREKRLKGWSRAKKIALIEAQNPSWRDLSLRT